MAENKEKTIEELKSELGSFATIPEDYKQETEYTQEETVKPENNQVPPLPAPSFP